jgi:hypothetical protein
MQPEPYQQSITIWEMVIFSTNRSLSLILDIPLIQLNLHPLLNFITLEDNKYMKINTYFKLSINNPKFLDKTSKIFNRINPIEKQMLFNP